MVVARERRVNRFALTEKARRTLKLSVPSRERESKRWIILIFIIRNNKS